MAYVLKDGEQDAPDGLKLGLRNANRMQDIVTSQLKPGRTGNEILNASLAQMHTEGINGTVYSHPIGDWGHSAGPLIGLWDVQRDIPIRGDVKVRNNTWFSIELTAVTPIPEWGNQHVSFPQEEDVVVDENGAVHWVYARQDSLLLVGTKSSPPASGPDPLVIIIPCVIGLIAAVIIAWVLIWYIKRRKAASEGGIRVPLILDSQ